MLTNENLAETQEQQVKKELSNQASKCIAEIMLNYYNIIKKNACEK